MLFFWFLRRKIVYFKLRSVYILSTFNFFLSFFSRIISFMWGREGLSKSRMSLVRKDKRSKRLSLRTLLMKYSSQQIKKEALNLVIGYKVKNLLFLLIFFFYKLFLMINNYLVLMPYIFPVTSHTSLGLNIRLIFWVAIFFFKYHI